MTDFVHLSVHTEYSIVDSVVFLEQLAPAIKDQGMTAVALTDKSNLTAMLKFQSACAKERIKPIFGCDINVFGELGPSRLLLLATNQTGYRNLIRLVTETCSNSKHPGSADYESLAEFNEGLIVLSGGVKGEIGRRLLNENPTGAAELLDWYRDRFGDRFYVELTRTGRKNENAYIEAVVPLASDKGIPLVATNDVICLQKDDYTLHDAKLCIQRHEQMGESYSWKGEYSESQHLRNAETMCELFKDLPDAIENTVEIAKRCNVKVETGEYYQRPFPSNDEATNDETLKTTVASALEAFLRDERSGVAPEDFDTYRARAEYELDVITEMGYAGYFMIVRDFVVEARKLGIPVGPGRGSGSASLVSMLLEITELDPIKHKLFFERLLNLDRKSMPDLDIDFCSHRRDEVMAYVIDKYGKECVGLIATQGTLGAKSVLYGMARAMNYALSDVTRITRLIPARIGIKLAQACEEVPEIEQVAASFGGTELLEESRKLEGIVYNTGVHAAGLVIAPDRLDRYVPCHRDADSGLLVTQLDKDDVEKAGLVKFDLLSLKNLTVIERAVQDINRGRQNGDPPLDLRNIPFDDVKTYQMIAAADTIGVFQLESEVMQRLLRQLRPDQFDDLIAVEALVRPGPMNAGIDKSYVLRKRGDEKITTDHPLLEPVLEDTYGLMIYQEDVMAVSRALAKFSGGDADTLREAMGKKRREKIDEMRIPFEEGCEENNVDARIAKTVYDKMEGFSEYAFPRAHSTAYAVVTYQTAYLKAHYPNEYMAAVVSVERGDPKRVTRLLTDADRMGLTIEPPDVNTPAADCVPTSEGFRLGMRCVKSVGSNDVSAIEHARRDGEFKSMFDFCMRVDLFELKRLAIENLIKAGAFDALMGEDKKIELSRASALDQLDRAFLAGRDELESGQGLFGAPEEEDVFPNYVDPAPLTTSELQAFELDAIGFVLNGESSRGYFREFEPLCTCSLSEASVWNRNQEITVAGTIRSSEVRDRSGRGEIANLVLEGQQGSINAVLWPEQYEKYSRYVIDNQFVIAKGRVRYSDFSGEHQLSVNSIYDVQSARNNWRAQIALRFDDDSAHAKLTAENLEKLEQLFTKFERKKGRPLDIEICKDGAKLSVDLGTGYRKLPVTDQILDELRNIFGRSVVNVGFKDAVQEVSFA